jgi:hypothetical protein
MSMSIQGNASRIGAAPQSQGQQPGATGGLPDLAPSGQTPAPGVGSGQAAPGAQASGETAPVSPLPDITKQASSMRWLGPIMAIGGGVAAIAAFKNPNASRFLKFGGISAALSGLALTGMGFKAQGVKIGGDAREVELLPKVQAYQAQVEQQVAAMQQQYESTIAALQQQISSGNTGTNTPGTPGPGNTGTNTTGTTTPGTPDPTTGTTGTSGVTPSNWTPQALVGTTLKISSGASAAGTPIASEGSFTIEGLVGEPSGYASLAEANAALQGVLTQETMGVAFKRAIVVEHGGKYYAVSAVQAQEGAQTTPFTAQHGTVASWAALNHVTEAGTPGWQGYLWTKDGGATSQSLGYGESFNFGGGAAQAPPSGSVDGGGPITYGGISTFDSSSVLGRTFELNAAQTSSGIAATGGVLQVQKVAAGSARGYTSVDEAVQAARGARAQLDPSNPWSRVVTLQGPDNKYYVYEASIVRRSTQPLEQAAPLHVFGTGFAEFFDAATNGWQAIDDAA